MFVKDVIMAMYYTRQLYKFEREAMFVKPRTTRFKDWFKRKFETKKAKAIRLAKEEEERKQRLKESNERLALLLLSECVGNEDNMNKACDLIKQMGLVEGYE